jgi:cyclophilin family peptidyl-prolyl cis-trans isomerase
MMKSIYLLTAVVILSFSACDSNLEDGLYANINTNKGEILVKLTFEQTPITVANFVSLSEGTNNQVDNSYSGKPFYNGLKFHRVINDFMIQGGDPNGTGSGGPGYAFDDEFVETLKHDGPGVLSMANSGPATNGSQFFITHKETPWLDGGHSVFGKVISGQQVVDSIAQNDTIVSIQIVRKGKAARAFDAAGVFDSYFAKKDKVKNDKAESLTNLKEQAQFTESGLGYVITEEGSGEGVSEDKTINTHYAVYFEDGSLLDTSIKSIAEAYKKVNPNRTYQPIPASVGPEARMIEGFKEGLSLLSVGDKATLFLPYELAYGESGNRGIPPMSNLIFEVEIVSTTE